MSHSPTSLLSALALGFLSCAAVLEAPLAREARSSRDPAPSRATADEHPATPVATGLGQPLASSDARGSVAVPAPLTQAPVSSRPVQAPVVVPPRAATAPVLPVQAPAAVLSAAVPVAAISQDPRPTLDSGTFINTVRAASRYKDIAEVGGWPMLPDGTILKLGDKGPTVSLLRLRLAAEGDLSTEGTANLTFDAELSAAVKRFQARHGLPESGAVRARTLAALNVPADTRHRQLAASAQRLMLAGAKIPAGERYVVVNIPSAAVEAVENAQVIRRYVAVVGKPDRPSPVVETKITAVNLNPTWTVPVSLIRKDIIPQMRKDPTYLAKMKIRVLDGKGQEVDPATIDWLSNSAVNYTLRQDPGSANSLGQIRIDMPNRHAVYLHDTSKKRLFAEDARFHSSGCVRVADVIAFTEWLLRDTPSLNGAWSGAELEAAISSGARQDIRIERPVPVAWVYLTGYATADGVVHFRDDVYGLDIPKTDVVPDTVEPDVTATSSIAAKPPKM